MTAPGGIRGTSFRAWADAAGLTEPEAALAGADRGARADDTGRGGPELGAEPWAAGGDGVSLRDWAEVAELLGRQPQGGFRVWVRNPDGSPRVIRNDPLLADGTPMPTRYWLVSAADCLAVSRLESRGGVRQAEAAVDASALEAAHAGYAAERDAALPAGHTGPRPTGGVGGTRRGVKCLHAHYAWHLAGGADPVGAWVADELAAGAAAVAATAAPASGARGHDAGGATHTTQPGS
ncbi:MAG: DUF501 domain-containing protein [bacterium]|nr:DUF501 domain-containing protein [bacterium]